MRPGLWELAIVLLVVVLIIGPRKLPELGRGLAGALTEFRKGRKGLDEEGKEDGKGADGAG